MSNTTIKGRKITGGMVLAGGIQVIRVGLNGKRRRIATFTLADDASGTEYTFRIDPSEDYTLA